ncbi:MAG: EAL domain-containing protein [Gemmatimonadetes bacterium]|nr:EAL domain-containing protein [Gemmatimonadota bacterium]
MTGPSATFDVSSLRVLVVDDQEHARRYSQCILNEAGIDRVTLVGSGRDAIAAVAEPEAAFDLIMCDLQMPGVDGVETVRALAAMKVHAAIVIMSVENERVIESAGLLALAGGLPFFGGIAKPLTLEKLQPVLARLNDMRRPAGAPRRAPSLAELEHAIVAGEIVLEYQPKIDIRSGAFAGSEALVRWRSAALGVLEPSTVLAIAEQSDALVERLTTFVLDSVLTFIGQWPHRGPHHAVSVNLSARAFDVLDLPEHLASMCITHCVDPQALTIAVDEAQVSLDAARTRDVLTRLRLKRCGLALDRFGRGASGLHWLWQSPFTEIKIDPVLVHGCAGSAAQRSVVEASIAMARGLGVVSVADGVHGRSEWTYLQRAGCDHAQGPFIARPMTAVVLEAWATQWIMQHAQPL